MFFIADNAVTSTHAYSFFQLEARRSAGYSNTMVADKVLLKQRHVNKFTTTFVPTPYSFTEKTGKQGVIRSPDGKTMKRNVSHTRPDPNHHREP